MLKRILAVFMCLALMVCAFGAMAEETAAQESAVELSPEDIIGKLTETAMAAALARGDQIKGYVNVDIDNIDSLGEEGLLVKTLFGTLLYTYAMQMGENAGQVSYGITAKDEELASLDVSYFNDVLYASSDLWGGETLKLSITDALTYLMSMVPEEEQESFGAITALANTLAEQLLDPATWESYIGAAVAWSEEYATLVQSTLGEGGAAELGHPEAVSLVTLEITGPALQSLVDNLLNVLVADDNMLGMVATIAEAAGSPMAIEDLKATITQFQGMAGAILGGMMKTITYTYLYDANETLVYYGVTGGMIISEEQSADYECVYDLTVVEGVTYVALNYTFDAGDGTAFAATVQNEVEPIVEADGVYTQNQTVSMDLEFTSEGETGSAYAVVALSYSTGADSETKSIDMEFGVDGILADALAASGDTPIIGMKSYSVSTTDVTADGFVTTIDQTMEYILAQGAELEMPIIHETVTYSNAPGEALTEPTEAIDVLTLTEEDWTAFGQLIEQQIEALGQKFIELYPELAAVEIDLGSLKEIEAEAEIAE
ncbi:hypothetical protein FACS1894184_19670 [Clostridia bacterium]|nr:hypothetical protein FACS1894184_19670 [Clostridia bacterium]